MSPTPEEIRTLDGRTTRGALAVLKEELKRWVLAMPRHKPRDLKRHHCGPGVYLFFNRGEPLRAGSSRMVGIRVTNQLGDLRRVLASDEADRRGIKFSTASACKSCGHAEYTQTPEYNALEESVELDLRVAFVPMETLIGTGMEVRQFEGLVIWAFSPPLNSKDEIRKLYRRDSDGSIHTDVAHDKHDSPGGA